jgi:hypothetical protein
MRMDRDRRLGLILLVVGVLWFLIATGSRIPRLPHQDELSVATPVPLQLLASFGDRFLAANFVVWRTLLVGSINLPPETLKAQAKLQEDASFFNPGHEDNYVMATAILPWEGMVEPTQVILRRATEIRKTDPYAPFFYGFNQIHFFGDAVGAYKYGQIAASRAQSEQDRQGLTVISAAWLERGNDPATSVGVIGALAESMRDPGLKSHLLMRKRRQEIMIELQNYVSSYQSRYQRLPENIENLKSVGMPVNLPVDPLGTVNFFIDPAGVVRFSQKK